MEHIVITSIEDLFNFDIVLTSIEDLLNFDTEKEKERTDAE